MTTDFCRSLVGGGFSCHFQCTEDTGALLVLGDSATSEEIHPGLAFEKYVRKHYTSWHTFAVEEDLAPKAEDVFIVTSVVKTSKWTVAVFREKGEELDISLSGGFEPYASASISASMSQHLSLSGENHSGPLHRFGKKCDSSEKEPARDQCVFLSGYKPPRRINIPLMLRAAADHDRDSGSPPPESPDALVHSEIDTKESGVYLCELSDTPFVCL